MFGGFVCTRNFLSDSNTGFLTSEYDGFDRMRCITYPDDTNEVFGYDKNSNITSYRNQNQQTITYVYDSLNRMTSKTRPGEAAITYAYDEASRLP